MENMKKICVFCGSSPGADKKYIQAAGMLGRRLAEKGIVLVYGGAKVGTMGHLAKSCIEAGGEVIGVIPKALADMEVAYSELAQLFVVDSMHERKAKMADLSDGFIALPGGLGTIEEFFEVLTWAQLGMHQKPCGLLNISHYYDRLLEFLNHAVDQQFIQAVHKDMIQVDETVDGLLEKFASYEAPQVNKAAWILKLSSSVS